MPKDKPSHTQTRRTFFKTFATAGIATATAPYQTAKASMRARVDYPSTRLANLKDLKINQPIDINYPDAESPGVLVKLGRKLANGVGPDQDVVAYSTLCPHKGFRLIYDVADKTLNCPGHYSRFDAELSGQQIFGMCNQNLPQFSLYLDDKGDIFADGADELIYGRTNNVLGA